MLMHVSRYLFSKLLLLCKNGLVWVEQNPSWSDVFRTDLTSLRLCCSDQMWFRLKEERRARTKFPAVINKTLLLNRCGRHRINTAMVIPWKSLVQQTPGYVCGCSSEGSYTGGKHGEHAAQTQCSCKVCCCVLCSQKTECRFTVLLLPTSTPSGKWDLSSFPAGHPFPLTQKQKSALSLRSAAVNEKKKVWASENK